MGKRQKLIWKIILARTSGGVEKQRLQSERIMALTVDHKNASGGWQVVGFIKYAMVRG